MARHGCCCCSCRRPCCRRRSAAASRSGGVVAAAVAASFPCSRPPACAERRCVLLLLHAAGAGPQQAASAGMRISEVAEWGLYVSVGGSIGWCSDCEGDGCWSGAFRPLHAEVAAAPAVQPSQMAAAAPPRPLITPTPEGLSAGPFTRPLSRQERQSPAECLTGRGLAAPHAGVATAQRLPATEEAARGGWATLAAPPHSVCGTLQPCGPFLSSAADPNYHCVYPREA